VSERSPVAHPYTRSDRCVYPMDDGGSCDRLSAEHVAPISDSGPPPKWPCKECRRGVVPSVRGKAPRHYSAGGNVCSGSWALVDMTEQGRSSFAVEVTR
jgi:hypothetical protein